MKVAISTENGQVAPHFGRCSEFTIAEIDDGRLVAKDTIPNPGHKPGFLPRFLAEKGINCIISGGMGQRAKQLFDDHGIKTIVGIEGEIDHIIVQYKKGNLSGKESYCNH